MFTKTFTPDHHIEELRAELRGSLDPDEACEIRAELDALLANPDTLADDETSAT